MESSDGMSQMIALFLPLGICGLIALAIAMIMETAGRARFDRELKRLRQTRPAMRSR